MSLRWRPVVAGAALILTAAAACADVVVLKSGLKLEGIVSRRGDRVEVRVPEGMFVYRADVVKEIRVERGALHEYEQRKARALPGDAAAQYALGQFCEARDMPGLAREAFERVVRLNPRHTEAHVKLGHIRVGDEWFSEWSYQEKLGHVRVDGEWVSRDVAAAREELRQMNWEVRSAAVTAYYRRLLEDERAAGAARGPSSCSSGVSAKAPGPWLADTLWAPGQTLRIAFADGTPQLQAAVRSIAPEWTRYANLDFAFAPAAADASRDDVRITFAGDGASSQLGRQSLGAARAGQPSMILNPASHGRTPEQWRRTILHEFGHALGLLHEHQNPNRTFKWNEEYVRGYFGRTGMSAEQTQANVLDSPLGQTTGGKAFDPRSIMMYSIPRESNSAGLEVGLNTELSPLDKEVASALYPGRGTTTLASPVAAARADNRDMQRLTSAVRALRRETRVLSRPVPLASPPERLGRDLTARARGLERATQAVNVALGARIRALGSRPDAQRVEAVNAVSRELATLVNEINVLYAALAVRSVE